MGGCPRVCVRAFNRVRAGRRLVSRTPTYPPLSSIRPPITPPPPKANLDKPLLFWGEDALLRWPGVWGPLIAERDAYMARVAAAAATGKPTGAPAYVADEAGGQLVWRYAMAAGGPEGSAPRGLGDGEYGPAAGVKNVVVVVGTAHVRGMCAAWEEALARPGDVGELAPAAERKPEDAAAAGSGAS